MPSKGMTVSPEYDADGNYAGSSISHHPNDAVTDQSGRVKNWEQDYYQDSRGETHHHFSETELMDERKSATDFDIDSYQQALTEAYPGLEAAIRWVETAPEFTDEDLQAYNKAFDNQDLSAMHEFYERLLPAFYASQVEQQEQVEQEDFDEDQADPELEEWFDALEEDGVINEHIEKLAYHEFSEDEIFQMEQAISSASGPEQEVLQMGIAVGNGQLTIDEAIAHITDQYGDQVAAAAYFNVIHTLSK